MTEANPAPLTLTPVQAAVYQRVMDAIAGADFILVHGEAGVGKTTVLKAVCEAVHGRFVAVEEVLRMTGARHARRFEQSVYDLLNDALDEADVIFFDDAPLLQAANAMGNYARKGVFSIVLRAIRDKAIRLGKTVVMSVDALAAREQATAEATGRSWNDQAAVVYFADLGPADYRGLLSSAFGESGIRNLDFERLHRSLASASARTLLMTADFLLSTGETAPDTDRFMDVLTETFMRSNVRVEEVEDVRFEDLVGVGDLVERLERTVLLPLTDPELAAELGLEAKHGVLLHGPPGTGKTTIGRALAHQMKGKFFIIDGDFMHDESDFFARVDQLFNAARRNSPSVIFIDDADVILGDPSMQHFGRYLLTKLDGLQSQSAGRTCVMMTAMDLRSMPPALLRSGRLEVWLETRAPSPSDRADMISAYVSRLPFDTQAVEVDALLQLTDGFTAADVRRLVGDAAGYLAFDRHIGADCLTLQAYLARAADNLRKQKAYAAAA